MGGYPRSGWGTWAASFFPCTHVRYPMSHVRRLIHPFSAPIHIVLALPDRQAPLQFLDDVARRFVCLSAVRMRDRDGDAGLSKLQRSDSMFDDDVGRFPPLRRLGCNARQLAL